MSIFKSFDSKRDQDSTVKIEGELRIKQHKRSYGDFGEPFWSYLKRRHVNEIVVFVLVLVNRVGFAVG